MSNTQKKNVPELRFPEFEGEWEEKQLGDLTTKIGSGKTPKGGSENYTNKGIPFLRSQNIRNGKLNLNDLVYISKDIDDEMKNSRTYYGDVLLNITGASIGRTAINSIVETHANLNQHVCIIRLKKEYYYIFFGQYLLSRKGKRKIFLAQSGGSREGINFKEIANLKIFTPTIFEEQQKIGKFFSKLDRQIELEEQKLELLQQQKKGYMQKIFTQELRFKDENGNDYPNWRTIELKNILENIVDNRGKTPDNAPSEKYPLLEVNALGYYRPSYIKVSKFVSENTYNNWFREHLKENDILFSTVGNTGIVSLMDNYKAVIAQNIVGLRVNNNNLPSFIYYMLSYKGNQKKIKRIQMGAVQPSVKVSQFKFIKYLVPIKDEQEKVAKLLIEIDKLVNKQLIKIELLQQRKKALLKSMFI
ncbi:restriction endonuclease subunit S [Staphylococcus aureus]|uniref:restriction endonuclease subunit S n=1 Tax=Staphylococcus aureus TaxID=1280 RepID=UPI0005C7AB4E|nr:restriction endonuclease subunit S [Staphylococcus aureus]MCS5330919.1 restriction endonuclease subunit S [Staphylococcus aureus]HEH7943891.1 restriction endonuclease subunit S [Staphylococcus aureus]